MINGGEGVDKPHKRIRGKGTGKGFFVLDRAHWEQLWSLPATQRMNVATAFLTMLAGTGADHRFTKWAVTSMANHTGMRKESGRAALEVLIDIDLVERAGTWTPTFPHHNVAVGKSNDAPIFLPISLVTGVGQGDASLLRRIREAGDPLLLRMLIDLYGAVTTDAPFSVALPRLRSHFKGGPGADAAAAELALSVGAHTVWQVAEPNSKHATNISRHVYSGKGDTDADAYWARVQKLEQIGAIIAERWVCSDASENADPIFPLTPELETAAADAGEALIVGPSGERDWMAHRYPGVLVPLPAHHQPPALQLLYRMRVEPDTPGRRAAYGERTRIIEHWLGEYERLEQDARRGKFTDPIRTQIDRIGPRPYPSRESR